MNRSTVPLRPLWTVILAVAAARTCLGQTSTPSPTQSSGAPATAKPTGAGQAESPARTSTTSPASGIPSAPGVQSTASPGAASATSADAARNSPTTSSPLTIGDAITRATSSDTSYASALADAKIATAQRGIALAALLPSAVYHNQFIYTQPLRGVADPATLGTSPRFIANNSVHEYVSQGIVTENLSAAGIADFRKAYFDAAAAKARVEVARRGLVESVINSYYASLAAAEKLAVAQQALDEALRFQQVSGQLEAGGEVAHLDVIKSRLQVQQRQRDVADAQLAVEKSRIDLGVFLFADPLGTYSIQGDLVTLPSLPTREQVSASAKNDNPDLRAAVAAFRAASLELTSTRLDYLPSLSLQYSYGIDAAQFAVTSPDGTRNLGYAAVATLDVPLFDWFATRDKARQSAARKQLAQIELSGVQRRMSALLQNGYSEAQVAQAQMSSLEASVRDATEALRLTELRYSAGEATILEVVDAQNTLITARNTRADGAARYFTALANLQTLTGNLP